MVATWRSIVCASYTGRVGCAGYTSSLVTVHRTKQVIFKVTEVEDQELRGGARRAGGTRSAWMRERLLEEARRTAKEEEEQRDASEVDEG